MHQKSEAQVDAQKFQSRNRDTFLFKKPLELIRNPLHGMFQSRNRDTFLFKVSTVSVIVADSDCFNLVIEILFFSSPFFYIILCRLPDMFQSRNRDTFLFKPSRSRQTQRCRLPCFNLVIEILFFSSQKWDSRARPFVAFQSRNRDTFLFKSFIVRWSGVYPAQFQSRNRDTFLFKSSLCSIFSTRISMFQSRNRDTFLFKSFKFF